MVFVLNKNRTFLFLAHTCEVIVKILLKGKKLETIRDINYYIIIQKGNGYVNAMATIKQ
jgi:hypothetical protein